MELNDIQKLMKVFDETGLNRLQYNNGGVSLVLEKGVVAPAAPMTPAAVSGRQTEVPEIPPTAVPAEAAAVEISKPQSGAQAAEDLVKAPMVGVFYLAPSPDASPYVQPGQRVEKGQTLCILEAMKVMNELQAEWAGTVEAILAQPEEIVEYGQPLFRIRRDA